MILRRAVALGASNGLTYMRLGMALGFLGRMAEAAAWGRIDAHCGAYAARSVEDAVGLLRAGRGRALVTAPIHKEALSLAGVDFPGSRPRARFPRRL